MMNLFLPAFFQSLYRSRTLRMVLNISVCLHEHGQCKSKSHSLSHSYSHTRRFVLDQIVYCCDTNLNDYFGAGKVYSLFERLTLKKLVMWRCTEAFYLSEMLAQKKICDWWLFVASMFKYVSLWALMKYEPRLHLMHNFFFSTFLFMKRRCQRENENESYLP